MIVSSIGQAHFWLALSCAPKTHSYVFPHLSSCISFSFLSFIENELWIVEMNRFAMLWTLSAGGTSQDSEARRASFKQPRELTKHLSGDLSYEVFGKAFAGATLMGFIKCSINIKTVRSRSVLIAVFIWQSSCFQISTFMSATFCASWRIMKVYGSLVRANSHLQEVCNFNIQSLGQVPFMEL